MKKILKINCLAFALALGCAACNNDNGSSVSKGDPAIVHNGGDSSGGAGSSPSKLGSGTSTSTPTPNADTGASKQNRVGSDTSMGTSKSKKIP